jgi:hypothetical protein
MNAQIVATIISVAIGGLYVYFLYNRTKKMRPDLIKPSRPQKKENEILKVENQNIGIIKMFENSIEKIPIYLNYDNMIRYHFGIFSFTGGEKSNLLSNLLRKIPRHRRYKSCYF